MMFAMLSDAVLDIPLTHVKEINDERTARYVPPGEFKDDRYSWSLSLLSQELRGAY